MSFKTYTLGEIASNTSRRFNFVGNEQVCFINTGDILDGHFLTNERVQSKGLPGQAKKAIQHGDILYSEIRPGNKRHLLVEGDVDDYVVSTKFMVITCDHDVVLPEYLYLVLTSKECEAEFKVIADSRSGTFPQITFDAVAYYPIELPSLNEQRNVVEIIKSITQKLNVNKDINSTSEDIAQAIFKSWFVDFDPVKAKMNGEQPEGMDAATASLFPEKLVESELGLIPEGWHIHNTQDLFEVRDGTHDSPKKAENGYYLVTSKHITKGKIDTSSAYLISELDFEQVNQRSKVDTFDILLTMIGTVGEVVVVYDNPVEFAIKNVGLFKTSQKPELVWLFYWHLQSFKMKNYLEVRMAGTTQQYLTLKTLRTIPVLVPSQNLLQKFNELISPLMGKISDNHNQNQSLSEMRDILLPKLLSGEIDLDKVLDV
ncbi:restriction modification system DNA specificity domain protein (plasmid) [Shewanella baltica OS223]|uniref:restriction endonuclease subunit S n=1 Tax=Shewanella baltica TaxID=62322 RepID=UPI00015307BE|nr:restriction endonuclease subunit S [Shewanella baltica]ACK48926.1 restriction modification system DNA specificity domain protein [Shewanella baltica OS223]